ncbi:MAG: ANTAR domain-containing protein [Ornithinibacter sp.]
MTSEPTTPRDSYDTAAIACLNVFSDETGAFDDASLGVGLLLATHASLLVTVALERDHARNLERALQSNREIGVAIGVLMQRHRLSKDQAFDVLRLAREDSNRKLAEVATEAVETGTTTVRGLG